MNVHILENSGFNPDKKLKIVGTSPVKHDGIDKVTGRAKFAADLFLPGMLVGKILRSPHAHANIKSIDISAAEKLPGVKAVITRDDFPEIKAGTGDGDITRNAMAREKALYDGHPVAAVAATSESIAKAGAQAHQGRVRGATTRHRPGRSHATRCADPASARPHQRREGSRRRTAFERDREAHPQHGRRRPGLRRGRRDRRA